MKQPPKNVYTEISCHEYRNIPFHMSGAIPIREQATLEELRGMYRALYWVLHSTMQFLQSENIQTDSALRACIYTVKRRIVQSAITQMNLRCAEMGYRMRDIWGELGPLPGGK